ncbi:hypothetical protein LX36DRAFT_593142 [Colletotrichum falcatum]|nr:hypothetical protein LX36DRAFT_593142 [Colletotrichum falcatum]
MPSSKSDFVVPQVVAVREDEGRPPEIIPPHFQLRVRQSQQGLVLFSLTICFTDGTSANKTTIYLQITADSIDSLERTDHSETDTNTQNPHYLQNIYQQLKDMHSITRLQFRLRNGESIQLAVPYDFNPENIHENTTRSIFEWVESLAASSTFSIYFQHNVLKKAVFLKYKEAILPLTSVTEALRKSYKGMRNVKRLYNGRGGKVHIPRHCHRHPCHASSPPSREHCSPPSTATTSSCGSTLPFETVPRPQQESPPPYDECMNEGQSPRVRSDPQSPGGDLSLLNHGDTKRQQNVLYPSLDTLTFGKENTNTTSKRKRSFAASCSPRTSRPSKLPPPPFLDPNDENNAARFLHLLELQRQQIEIQRQQIELQREQIEQLQKNIGDLQRWHKELEGRHDELEADCSKLETRQDQADDAIDNLSVDLSELEDKYAEVVHQIPDVCDEFKDLKENVCDTFKEDMCKLIEDSMSKQIVDCVEAQANEVKRRIRQALQ